MSQKRKYDLPVVLRRGQSFLHASSRFLLCERREGSNLSLHSPREVGRIDPEGFRRREHLVEGRVLELSGANPGYLLLGEFTETHLRYRGVRTGSAFPLVDIGLEEMLQTVVYGSLLSPVASSRS